MSRWRVVLLVALVVSLSGRLALTAAQTPCYSPQEAAAHVGQYGCVSGQVTRVFWARESTGRPTFVDMGRSFTVVIWEEDRDRFQPTPESWRGTTLTVWGQIRLYEGRAEIVLRSPAQFVPPAMARPTPPPTLPPTPPTTVSPRTPAPAPVQAAPPVPATPPPATPPPATPQPTSPPTPEPTPEPSPSSATPTPVPFPAAPGPVAPQARVVLTPVPAVLEGPVDGTPLPRPVDDRGGPPLVLIAGAVALLVLGLGGSVLAGRKRP